METETVSYCLLKDGKIDTELTIDSIYEEHYKSVYGFLICFTGNKSDAEDLTQEVFIKVIKSIANFNRYFQLRSWILSIAKHVAIDHYRRKKFYSLFNDNFFTKLVAKTGSPQENLDTKETNKIIQESLTKLKPNYRSVFILRAINDLSIRETALILNCSESKVKVDYHRAVAMLQKLLTMSMKGEIGI
ncbi:RNA polymerase sigma-70 factor (ECF subfamily) [Paenibacillus sp. V4I9]|uniref:RNA polymerase sigma factor n=1 Tax=Paenibacillus sp. V4I9 TaxID=3042308 RepID=UPI0027878415|nr:sigma-70 family RNA polymerase sigma factor [Paenibacillus sp. V4I9]MDQ0888784.1 RNA polymerase sigma-70 factor (ECF subfamily) [Paenibacillus sp. V4I9]